MSEELKPCPFCGAYADNWTEFDTPRAGCSNDSCIATGGITGYSHSLWNRRAESSELTTLRARVAELEGLIAGAIAAKDLWLPTIDGSEPDSGFVDPDYHVPHQLYKHFEEAMQAKKK